MKLKKVLLSCAIFVVVSLCSFIVAYADGVTGSVTAAMLDYTHYFNSNTVQDDTYVNLRSYDFPITSQVKLWKITNNSLGKFITVGFDSPVHDGVLYFEGYDQYVHWNGLDSVFANFENGTSKNISSLVTYSVDSDNWITFTVNLSSITSSDYSSRGDISYLTIYFPENQGSIHSELDCMYCNLFNSSSTLDDLLPILNSIYSTEQDISSDVSQLVDFFIKSDWDPFSVIYNAPEALSNGVEYIISYDTALSFVDYLNSKYIGVETSQPVAYSSKFYTNSYGLNTFDSRTYLTCHFTWYNQNVSHPVNEILYFKNKFNDLCCFRIDDVTNYDSRTADAVEAILSILEDSFSDGRDQLDDATDEATSALEAQEELESHFQGSMTSNFNALNVSSFTFDTDAQNGLAMAGDVFSEIWGAFGKWSILYSFPLLLGVVLLLIGKISKSAGRSSSKGKGDDE